jgi:ANTAR domain-containing protein
MRNAMDVHDSAVTPANGPTTGLSLDEVLDAIARAHPGALDSEEATTALRQAREEIETLKEALRTRTVIGQAVGLLMYESTITSDAAFAQLVANSSHTNVKLRDIATRLVEEANEQAVAGRRQMLPRLTS